MLIHNCNDNLLHDYRRLGIIVIKVVLRTGVMASREDIRQFEQSACVIGVSLSEKTHRLKAFH